MAGPERTSFFVCISQGCAASADSASSPASSVGGASRGPSLGPSLVATPSLPSGKSDRLQEKKDAVSSVDPTLSPVKRIVPLSARVEKAQEQIDTEREAYVISMRDAGKKVGRRGTTFTNPAEVMGLTSASHKETPLDTRATLGTATSHPKMPVDSRATTLLPPTNLPAVGNPGMQETAESVAARIDEVEAQVAAIKTENECIKVLTTIFFKYYFP
jgi:hypothetical protein